MAVLGLPIGIEATDHQAQNVTGQMLHAHPRRNQKARIVGQQVDVALARMVKFPRTCIPPGRCRTLPVSTLWHPKALSMTDGTTMLLASEEETTQG
jgi:hypothetical protein